MSYFSAPDAARDSAPADASSVILLREGPVGPEVFLLRRHGKSAFMGGAYVFPGGKIDPEDAAAELSAHVRWEEDLARQEPSPGRAWGLSEARAAAVAALRELFEEAGVLIARRRGEDQLLRLDDDAEEWGEHRRALHDGERSFLDIVAARSLELAGEQLVYFDHWITPSAERRRFDARFFLARLPEGQTPKSDERETSEALWATPRACLDHHERGEVFLPPPTQRMLEVLAETGSVAAALELAARRPVVPLLPRIGSHEGRLAIFLPWSNAYDDLEGEGAPVPDGAAARSWPPMIVVPTPEDRPPPVEVPSEALGVLKLWFGPDLERSSATEEVAARWWKKDPDFDATIRDRFGALRDDALAGRLDHWQATPYGTLALVILLDQFSRNVFRGSPRAFEADPITLRIAEAGIRRGDDQRVSPMLRMFFYMPMMHAEDRARQAACCLAFERLPELSEGALRAAHAHREIVERFGRFPHRNEVLGRLDTPEEAAWLASGDRGF